jgi:hypothetical protein
LIAVELAAIAGQIRFFPLPRVRSPRSCFQFRSSVRAPSFDLRLVFVSRQRFASVSASWPVFFTSVRRVRVLAPAFGLVTSVPLLGRVPSEYSVHIAQDSVFPHCFGGANGDLVLEWHDLSRFRQDPNRINLSCSAAKSIVGSWLLLALQHEFPLRVSPGSKAVSSLG